MKKNILFFLLTTLFFTLFSCNKEENDRWNVEVKTSEPVKITDISAEFYNEKIPFQEFKEKYSFFLAPQVPDATYEKKRNNTIKILIIIILFNFQIYEFFKYYTSK